MSLHSIYRAVKSAKAPYLPRKFGRESTFQLCLLSSESSGRSKARLVLTRRTTSPDTTVTKLIEKVFPKHRLKFPETDKTHATNENDSKLKPEEEGTRLHSWIERFYKDLQLRDADDTGEELLEALSQESGGEAVDCRQLFLQFWRDHSEAFVSHESERNVSCSELHITGRVDFLGMKKDGTGTLIDWKRSRHPLDRDATETDKFANPPLEDLPATPYLMYAARMNLYRYLIEQETGIDINTMQMIRFHPTISEYEITQVAPMPSEVRRLLAYRRKEVADYWLERKKALHASRGARDDYANKISSNSKRIDWVCLARDW